MTTAIAVSAMAVLPMTLLAKRKRFSERRPRATPGQRIRVRFAIRLLSRAASGGVCAALDEDRLGQMKRLYVRAPLAPA